eukprot:INCI19302.1.p1 GENE.INCI19302.1~~INCI19302.1.p1  ORF type:complete len:388 (-),score=59.47 INCI19302.1:418-1581(-)
MDGTQIPGKRPLEAFAGGASTDTGSDATASEIPFWQTLSPFSSSSVSGGGLPVGDVPNEKPVWGATHIKDLQIQIFDKNTTLYELDCPHIRQLPAAPILPRGFSLNDASHDLTKGCCATCENKWLDPQDEEDEDKLGTLLKQQFVAEHKQNSDSFRVHAENWVCLFCGGIFCGRYENKHFFDHLVSQPGIHCLAISINELAVWCHGCNKYIDTHMQELQPFVKFYEALKFERKAPSPIHDDGPCTHADHVPAIPPPSLKLFQGKESQCCECAQLTEPAQSKRARHALMLETDDAGDVAKESAGQTHEDYLCLTCFQIYCGRYEAGHMYKHVQTAKFKDHQLALDLNSLNIWCYACSAYINIKEDFASRHPNVHSLLEALTKQKLGNQ